MDRQKPKIFCKNDKSWPSYFYSILKVATNQQIDYKQWINLKCEARDRKHPELCAAATIGKGHLNFKTL